MSGTTKYGLSSLYNNTGPNNSGFGEAAAFNNLDASCNTAIGANALYFNTDGPHNTAIGAGAMCNNVGGYLNTAVGSSALEGLTQISVGNQNVAIGAQALYSNSGNYNVGVGCYALLNNTDGSGNTAVGYSTLQSNDDGIRNTAVGFGSLPLNNTGNQNTAVGNDAGLLLTGNSNYNTFLGGRTAVDTNLSLYSNSTALGYQATIDASNQIVLGTALESVYIPGSYVGIRTYNPGNGFTLDVSGNLNTTMDASINSITVGLGGGNLSTNTAIGFEALLNNTSGQRNTAIGCEALNHTEGGGSQNTGDNTVVGYTALYNNIDGSCNTAVGSGALYYNLYSNNSAFGYFAGVHDISGNTNTFVGANTDVSNNGTKPYNIYNYSTALGYNAIIDASNQIVLGTLNESVYIPGSYLGIGTYAPGNGYALDVSGNANISGIVNATSFNTPSDYRIKENVTQLDSKFVVDNLNPVTYLNKKSEKQDIGLIAHELQEIFPELVNGEKDGEQFQSVNYIGLIPILIKEIQDLKERVKILEE